MEWGNEFAIEDDRFEGFGKLTISNSHTILQFSHFIKNPIFNSDSFGI